MNKFTAAALVAGISLGLIGCGFYFIPKIIGQSSVSGESAPNSSKSSSALQQKTEQTVSAAYADLESLKTQLQNIIDGQPGISTSVTVTDTESGQSITAGLNEIFRGASTTKLITAAAYFDQVEQGEASLSTIINGETAQSLIAEMITQSDNDAWYSLINYLGYDSLQTYGDGIGLKSWDSYNNTITTSDEALLLYKLYKQKLLNSSHASLLLNYMSNTNSTDLISAAVPSDAKVYHKYGRIDGELHDAAIITYNGHTYVLVILTYNQSSEINDYAERVNYIHQMTTATTDFMSSL